MRQETYAPGGETVVTEPVWVRGLAWVGLPLLGAGLGWLLKAIAGWVVSLPWAPFQGPFRLADRLITSFGEPQATVGALALGTVVGLGLALIAEQERLVLTFSEGLVTLKRGEAARAIGRTSVDAVFLDGDSLVLLGHAGEELARERSDLDRGRLQQVFSRSGFPWLDDGDPYQNTYRLWVEGASDLPTGAGALLAARERALARGDGGEEDAAALRAELARLGIVVREEKGHQYWRRTSEQKPG